MTRRLGLGLVAAMMASTGGLAHAATASYEASFQASGGDARTGDGDSTTIQNIGLAIPFFDPALGTLQKVAYDLSGWRSLDLVCTDGGDDDRIPCNARIDVAFELYVPEGGNKRILALINPRLDTATFYSPPNGGSVSDRLYDEDQTSGEITDLSVLALMTVDGFSDMFRLALYGYDGGAWGQGGTTFFSSRIYDADATARITYHYLPAGGGGGVTEVPEPTTLGLLGASVVAMAVTRRRRERHGA
jgi:hypothetical protein